MLAASLKKAIESSYGAFLIGMAWSAATRLLAADDKTPLSTDGILNNKHIGKATVEFQVGKAGETPREMRMRFLPVLGVCFILAGLPPSATAQPLGMPALRDKYPEEYHPSLKDEGKPVPGLVFYGPDAEECVRFEPEGLHISLPTTYPRQRPGTGVVTDFGVQGDFEITLSFEILEDGRLPTSFNPTLLKLMVVPSGTPKATVWQQTHQNRASLSRELPRGKTSGQFVAGVNKWKNEALPKDQWGNEDFKDVESEITQQIPATEKTGHLRMVRHGSELFFFTSEGNGDLTLLHRVEFGTRDLKNVRILASTGWMGTAFDVRITDLVIRAEAFPKSAGRSLPSDSGSGDDAPRSMQWKVIALASGVSAAIALCLIAVYYTRTRRRAIAAALIANTAPIPPAPAPSAAPSTPSITSTAPPDSAVAPPIIFACPGCNKRLRVKAQNAGAKLKCPECGAVVTALPGTVKPEETP